MWEFIDKITNISRAQRERNLLFLLRILLVAGLTADLFQKLHGKYYLIDPLSFKAIGGFLFVGYGFYCISLFFILWHIFDNALFVVWKIIFKGIYKLVGKLLGRFVFALEYHTTNWFDIYILKYINPVNKWDYKSLVDKLLETSEQKFEPKIYYNSIVHFLMLYYFLFHAYHILEHNNIALCIILVWLLGSFMKSVFIFCLLRYTTRHRDVIIKLKKLG